MIGYARDLLVEHVLAPQGLEDRGELRAVLGAEDDLPLDLVAQQLDVAEVDSRILPERSEIGGTIYVRNLISVALVVQHGDRLEARRLRDAIVLELILRATSRDTRAAMMNTTDPAAIPQEFDELTWTVDYRPLVLNTPNENATLVFSLDTRIDR